MAAEVLQKREWFMEIVFLTYCACVILVLIWCSADANRLRLEYRPVSVEIVNRWAAASREPLFFELHTGAEREVLQSDMLSVTFTQFESMVEWIPPDSVLVFRSECEIQHFDSFVEKKLLSMGIAAVYWMRDPHALVAENGKQVQVE
jgi:hypothetical protein